MKLLSYLNKSENSLAILLAIAALSMMFPYGFPLFGLSTIIFGFLKVVTDKFKLKINTGFILFFLSVITYFIGLFFSKGMIYSLNISDLTNIFSFIIIWALLSDLHLNSYSKLIHKFAKYIAFLSFAVAVISLLKFVLLLSGIQLEQFKYGENYPTGTSLVSDYNMFSFGLTAGLIMSTYLLGKAKKMSHMFYYSISFISIFSSIMLAGSRRAWIVAVFIAAFVILELIKKILSSNFERNVIRVLKTGFIAVFSALFIFVLVGLFDIDLNLENSRQIETLKYRFETLQLSQAQESFSPRTDRWEYALQLYGESNVIEFFLGQGFGYLTDFAIEFNTEGSEDYPHNPFLSTLLYSGLIGFVVVATLLLYSLLRALNNRKLLGSHFLFLYFVSWIFIIVSFNSVFSSTLFFMMTLFILSIPSQQREGINL